MKLLKEKLILEEPVDEINLGWVVVFRDMNDDSIVDGKKFETRSEAYEYMRQIQKEGVLKENPNLYIEIEEVDPAGSWAESLKEAKEDEVTIPEAELEQPIQVNDIPQDVVDNAYGNLISNSISREWDDINSYKDLVAQFVSDNQFPEVVDILNQLIDDKTINVGMLTKALELINGTEQNDLMQQGIDKAEEVISDERDLAKESIKEDLEHPAFPQVYDDETILDILGIEREVTDKERIKGHLKDRKELVRQFRKLVEKGYGEPQYEIYLKDDTPYYKDLGKVVDNSKDLVVIDTHQKVAEESLKEDIEEDKKKLNESTSIPDFANMLFDTIMNSPYEHLDDNKFEDELERPNEVDANKGIIRFNYDGKYFELTINEITDFDESYDAFDDDNEYIYQFPKDANLKYIQQNIELSPCNIKVIGRVNKKGDNPGDILLQGTKVDLEKFLDDYFDYEINDDYLYELDEFDTELISPISKKELKFEESKLTEGRYNDIQKQISETEKEIKELKDKLKETTDDEEIDKILEDIYIGLLLL